MALPKAKVNLYERRIARLKKQLDKQQELRAEMSRVFATTKQHYVDVVASHLAKARGLKTTLVHRDRKILEDAFRIQELDNQVAVQWRNLSEAKDDAVRAMARCSIAEKDRTHWHKEWKASYSEWSDAQEIIAAQAGRIVELERSLLNRLWVAIPIQWARFRVAVTTQLTTISNRIVNRIVNRFKIWRLNRARVEAISEAGYIPEKLIAIAQRYWEEDQKRLQRDEQIRAIHYGNQQNMQNYAVVERACRPSLLRRLAIILGRA